MEIIVTHVAMERKMYNVQSVTFSLLGIHVPSLSHLIEIATFEGQWWTEFFIMMFDNYIYCD